MRWSLSSPRRLRRARTPNKQSMGFFDDPADVVEPVLHLSPLQLNREAA